MRALLALLLVALVPGSSAAADLLELSSGPSRIQIETLPDRQDLNFEFFLRNNGDAPLSLRRVQVSVRDAQGRLLERRLLDGNGVRPSIQTLPQRDIPPGTTLTVFNPFPSFGRDLEIASLHYEMTLSEAAKDAPELVRVIEVRPVLRQALTTLSVPLRGRLINYDGHDALAHHRRFDYSFAPLAQMGFKSNFMRYAYDFVPVDADGEMVHGDTSRNENYVGFGAPVLATGDGVVAALENGQADNRLFDQSKIPENPMVLFGNYAVIDHGNGEFSVFGHLKQGSVRVKVGERVRRDQPIAAIGASGSAFFPHLHYQLQDAPTLAAEGLPSYFSDFRLLRGANLQALKRATVDTGQIVESAR